MVNICSRTAEVQTVILVKTGGTCSTVTAAQLAGITYIGRVPDFVSFYKPPGNGVRGYSASSFVPSDLAGLTGLRHLVLTDSPMLTTLPDDAFSEAAGLTRLHLDDNNLTSLGAGRLQRTH